MKKLIEELADRLLRSEIVTQAVLAVLVDKKILTREEVQQKIFDQADEGVD